jgi:multidrug efflux system membrane fusion protein
LVTILQIVPVWVTFGVPEQHLNEIRKGAAGRNLQVQAIDAGSGGVQATGFLDVIDNSVDAATGTIKLKARFENGSRALWPGQFVDVLLQLRTDRGALTVPNEALQDGPDGRYVWVLTPAGTAQMRFIQVARVQGSVAVISGGLSEGETVVTFGHLGVRDGAPLRVMDAAKTAAGQSGQ